MSALRGGFALGAILALAACSPGAKLPVKLPFKLPAVGGPAFDKDKLESAIDANFGGVGACVVIDDTGSGAELYRYNSHAACMRRLPPCSTFDIANGLIGLDAGVVSPTSVLKWNGAPQPIKSWEQDADLKTAFKESIPWWQQAVAHKVGLAAYQAQLKAYGYGNHAPDGPIDSFWQGPAAGGGLFISTDEQAGFLHRLYARQLPVKPASAAYVEQIMVDEIRDGAVVSGKSATCASASDGGRQVGWWIGRLKTAKADYVFAASMESANDTSLPGIEIQQRAKTAFAVAGLWPPAP